MASTIVLITGNYSKYNLEIPCLLISCAGANSGVGFATSKVLACTSDSFHVIIASRSEEKAQAAKSDIEAAGIKGALSTLRSDVTDENSIKEAAAHVEKQFGRLDVLVNNAASGCMDPDVRTRFQLCLATNVTGPAMVAAAFRPLLLRSHYPYSIYVSSGARTLPRNAHQTPPTHDNIRNGDAYIVSKAAINMLAVLEAKDCGRKGLKVCVASPGFVRSNLRGPSEEARSGWGKAGDPEVSGELILSIVGGQRRCRCRMSRL
ncbi:short chain dehydrogenase/reductase [Rhizodiscina lignyota]|uniref:Short chain dehydrogenase/reductase n=1 Tax=Rhizodiscina lignyota TaxID=1504668 RepID=A0A9P4IQG4_9PEZI|nr:short chain dehydrogenase/reductase [Rhizodiscina lignyota]